MATIAVCFAGAALLMTVKTVYERRSVTDRIAAGTLPPAAEDPGLPDVADTTPPAESVPAATTTTLPVIDPDSKNFLLAAADGGACVDPKSPWANAGGKDRPSNSRSDTIMILRLDVKHNRIAALSFPRDLYVSIPGRGRQRINAAFRRNQPDRLIQTIQRNFGVRIDHYIQVDFCAFKQVVDAVGGVDIPFRTPIQDVAYTNLNIPKAGCHHFGGDEALAYARSRHLKQLLGGRWVTDGSSDFGRIARQQDLVGRVLARALDKGLLRPAVMTRLMKTLLGGHLVVSAELSPDRMIEFGTILRGVKPEQMGKYQVKSTGKTINGASVQLFNRRAKNMTKILQMFRGQAMVGSVASEVPSNLSGRILPDPNVRCG